MSARNTAGRLSLIVLFTIVETAALGIWLALVEGAPTLSETTVLGLSLLFVGLVLEHILTDFAVNGVNLSFPVGSVLFFSASETALWALWLFIAEQVGGILGFAAAAAVLAVLLVPQHTIEDNILRGRPLFSNVLDSGTVGFSLVESLGATIWLVFVLSPELVEPLLSGTTIAGTNFAEFDPALVGLAILAGALFVEHIVGVRFARQASSDTATTAVGSRVDV